MMYMPKRIWADYSWEGPGWKEVSKYGGIEYIRVDAIDTEALAMEIVNGPVVDWDAPGMGSLFNTELTRVKCILDTALQGGERADGNNSTPSQRGGHVQPSPATPEQIRREVVAAFSGEVIDALGTEYFYAADPDNVVRQIRDKWLAEQEVGDE